MTARRPLVTILAIDRSFDINTIMKINDILLREASYPGNIGAMEVFQFYKAASPEEKEEFDHLLKRSNYDDAWQLIQQVTHTDLHPMDEKAERFSSPIESITVSRNGKEVDFQVLDSKLEQDRVWNVLVQARHSQKWLRVDLDRQKVHSNNDKRILFVGDLIDIQRAADAA